MLWWAGKGKLVTAVYTAVYTVVEQCWKTPHSEKGQMIRPDAWQAAASEHPSDWEEP